MGDATPTGANWYPDPETGGTRYWDGSRWTGDVRPRRRVFAAEAWNPMWPGLIAVMAGSFAFICFGAYGETHEAFYVVAAIGVLIAPIAPCVWMLRGQGPTTQDVQNRVKEEEKAERTKRRTANVWGVVAGVERLVRPRSASQADSPVAVAQIDALSDPATARALQNLQNLLYTHTITDEEYAAAKAKLVGEADESFTQITKLAELHRAGILGDVEFAAAKARALGL